MTDIATAFRAGIDAVIADPTLNGGGFNDAMRTVLVFRFTNAQATGWRTAIATEYNRLGLINNPTYNNLRGNIISNGADASESLFTALISAIGTLPETIPAIESCQLIDLRADRDAIVDALARFDVLIAAEPNGAQGRLVRRGMRQAKDQLRQFREEVRARIRQIIGDPDA